jgi:hypothetical protein
VTRPLDGRLDHRRGLGIGGEGYFCVLRVRREAKFPFRFSSASKARNLSTAGVIIGEHGVAGSGVVTSVETLGNLPFAEGSCPEIVGEAGVRNFFIVAHLDLDAGFNL